MPSFASPLEAAVFFRRVAEAIPAAETRGLEAGARVLLAELKAEAGHYQGEVNGLPEWAELANRTKEERLKNGYTENDPLKASGELADSYEMAVHGSHAEVGTHDKRGAYLETGHDDEGHGALAPRPIVGGSLFRRIDDVVDAIFKPTFDAMRGKF